MNRSLDKWRIKTWIIKDVYNKYHESIRNAAEIVWINDDNIVNNNTKKSVADDGSKE